MGLQSGYFRLTATETIPPGDGVGDESLESGPVEASGAPSEFDGRLVDRVGGVVVEEGSGGDVEASQAGIGGALGAVGGHPQSVLGETQTVREVQRPRRDLRGSGEYVVYTVGVGPLGAVAVAGGPQRTARSQAGAFYV